jgi:hypothetical protein
MDYRYAVVFQNVTIGDRALGPRVYGKEAPSILDRWFGPGGNTGYSF